MRAEPIGEKVSDSGGRICVATTPECLAPQRGYPHARILAADPAVRIAYLFGSAARGEPFRDVDIGVVLDPDLGRGALRFRLIVSALEEALPGMAVDPVDLEAAAPAVRGQAVREGTLLVDRDPEARKEWEVHVTRVWLDLEPWVRLGEELRREAMRSRGD